MNPYTAKFQITGAIYKIGEVQTFESGFQKRELVVNTNTTRPSPVALSLFKEDVSRADGLAVGDEVTVEGTVNGREWQGPKGVKFFSDLIIRSIQVVRRAAGDVVGDWPALLAFAKARSIGDEAVKAACEAHKAKVNRKFTAADWAEVAKALDAKPAPAEDPNEDMPF